MEKQQIVERSVVRDSADTFVKGLDLAAVILNSECPEGFHCSRIVLKSRPFAEGSRLIRSQASGAPEAIADAERLIAASPDLSPVRISLKRDPKGSRTFVEIWFGDEGESGYCDVDVWFQRRTDVSA